MNKTYAWAPEGCEGIKRGWRVLRQNVEGLILINSPLMSWWLFWQHDSCLNILEEYKAIFLSILTFKRFGRLRIMCSVFKHFACAVYFGIFVSKIKSKLAWQCPHISKPMLMFPRERLHYLIFDRALLMLAWYLLWRHKRLTRPVFFPFPLHIDRKGRRNCNEWNLPTFSGTYSADKNFRK